MYNLFSATDVVKGSAVGKTSFFDCKLESTKIEKGESESMPRFNKPSVYSHFQGCSLLITSLFLLPRLQLKKHCR